MFFLISVVKEMASYSVTICTAAATTTNNNNGDIILSNNDDRITETSVYSEKVDYASTSFRHAPKINQSIKIMLSTLFSRLCFLRATAGACFISLISF